MKNDLETILTHISEDETLPEERRIHMRFVLEEYAALRPVRSAAAGSTFPTLLFAYFASIMRRPATVLALALLLVFTTTGSLAYASEGALPGDSLYGVKVGVVEPLRSALTFAPSAQAHWQMTLAVRRIDEAATLASRGTLSSTTQAQLSNDFNQNLVQARTFFAKDTAHSFDESDADVSMSARLSAYAMVFAQINTDHPSSEASSFHTTLLSSISTLSTDTLSLSAETASTSQSEQRATTTDSAVRARTAAQKSLAAIKEQLSQGQGQLTASSSIAAYARLNDATDLVQEGTHLYASGNSTAAADAFKNALSATTQLHVLIRAATLLKVDTLSGDNAPDALTNDALQSSISGPFAPPSTRHHSEQSNTATTTAAAALSAATSTTTSSVPQPTSPQTHTLPSYAAQNEPTTQLNVQPGTADIPTRAPTSLVPPILHISL